MLRKIASIMETILDVILIAAAVMLLVMPLCGYKPYIVRSGSMEPVIQTGAVAYINTHDVSPVQGEIAAYTLSNGEVVTHRVMQIDGDSYTFKGDANDTEDLSVVEESQIVGTYMFSVPKIGFVLAKIQENKLYMIPILCGIGAILLLCEAGSGDKENSASSSKNK